MSNKKIGGGGEELKNGIVFNIKIIFRFRFEGKNSTSYKNRFPPCPLLF